MTIRRDPAVAIAAALGLAVAVFDPRVAAVDAKRAALLAVVAVALAMLIARRARSRSLDGPAVLFFAFCVWSALAVVHGPASGWRNLATWVAGAGAIALVRAFPISMAKRAASFTAIVAGTLAALIAMVELASGSRGIFVHGGQGNANWLGLLEAVALPLTLACFRAGSRWRYVATAALATELAGLVVSHSRVAWVAVGIVATIHAINVVRERGGRTAIRIAMVAVPAAGVALVLARASSRGDVAVPLALSGRAWIWTTSAKAALASFPAGSGLGSFARSFLDAQGEHLAALSPQVASHRFLNATTAHCDYLEVAVESGFVGLALFVATLAAAIRACLRNGFIAGALAIGAFAITALGDSPLDQPAPLLLVALAVGASGASRRDRASPVPRGALLAAASVLLALASSAWLSDRALANAREAPLEAKLALYRRAAALDPRSGEAALELGLFEFETGDARGALDDLRRSDALLADASTPIAIGNALRLLDRNDEALASYQAALALDPGSFRAHAALASALVAAGRFAEAEQQLTTAKSLLPGDPRVAELAEALRRRELDHDSGEL